MTVHGYILHNSTNAFFNIVIGTWLPSLCLATSTLMQNTDSAMSWKNKQTQSRGKVRSFSANSSRSLESALLISILGILDDHCLPEGHDNYTNLHKLINRMKNGDISKQI